MSKAPLKQTSTNDLIDGFFDAVEHEDADKAKTYGKELAKRFFLLLEKPLVKVGG